MLTCEVCKFRLGGFEYVSIVFLDAVEDVLKMFYNGGVPGVELLIEMLEICDGLHFEGLVLGGWGLVLELLFYF